MAPVVLLALLQHLHSPRPDEAPGPRYWTQQSWRALSAQYLRRIVGPLLRTALFGVGAVALLLLIVWPYWVWTMSDPISQVPIPHASRDNFFVNLNAGLIFWLIPYGMLLVIMPYIWIKGFGKRTWPLTASIAMLALLGTGGTTPLPRLLLGGAFDILTLDRFTLWASILMLPLAGRFTTSLNRGNVGRWLQSQFGRATWHSAQLALIGGLVALFIFTVSLPQFRRFQPAQIEMQPIVNFLNKDQHWRWRYLTLGFGDQMAWLSIQTKALQVDGNYHSARRLPEMTTTAVERLEGAKFRGIPGIGSLQQFLNVPEKYNLKYIFSNDNFYDPLLFFYGWHRIGALENNVMVWEREDIPVLPALLPRREIPLYQRVMFGSLPLAALLAAVATTTVGYWRVPVTVVAELLGLQRQWAAERRRQQQLVARIERWLAQHIGQPLDNRLLAVAHLAPASDPAPPPWQARLLQCRQALQARSATVSEQTKRTHLLLLVGTLVLLLGVGHFWLRWQRSQPEAVIAAYYDDIDFKRFEAAYARLNPLTRPNFEEFMLHLSVQGGLLSSYSKLDALTMRTVSAEATHQTVAVTASYITALAAYTDTTTLTVDRVAGQWVIAPRAYDLTVPPDQFLRTPEVNWLAQGHRRVASGATGNADLLDRPDLVVLSARLVRQTGGAYSLVGEVLNQDVDPADVTVTGAIYDNRGNQLTWYNAGDAIMHKVLPLEITPFRIAFEGVAGAALNGPLAAQAVDELAFAPNAMWAYQPPTATILGKFDVVAKAVVTQRDLYRALGAQQLMVEAQLDGTLLLRGELINNDLREATIPHLLITLYDEQGEVMWVDHHYLPTAIRPQRTQAFAVPLTDAATIQDLALPGKYYTNSLQDVTDLAPIRTDFIPVPAGYAYRYLRVSVNYFVEEQ
jgi:hypothetical protein